MKYRTIIKKTGDWWIGWLIDLPGVNAQERTRDKLIESLMTGIGKDVTVSRGGRHASQKYPFPRRSPN